MSTSATQVRQCLYLNLEATPKGLCELSSKGARLVLIPKNEIENIQIKHGSHAERPVLQAIMGLVLVAMGFIGIYLETRGGRGITWGAGLLAFGGIGIYCLYEVAKRGPYLLVQCSGGARKLIPRGPVDEAEFAKFAIAASSLGYSLVES